MKGIIGTNLFLHDKVISVALSVIRPAIEHFLPGVCVSECCPHLHLYASNLLFISLMGIRTVGRWWFSVSEEGVGLTAGVSNC